MAEASLVSLAVVEHLDVFEQDRAELASGHLFPRPQMWRISRFKVAHVASVATLSKQSPLEL